MLTVVAVAHLTTTTLGAVVVVLLLLVNYSRLRHRYPFRKRSVLWGRSIVFVLNCCGKMTQAPIARG